MQGSKHAYTEAMCAYACCLGANDEQIDCIALQICLLEQVWLDFRQKGEQDHGVRVCIKGKENQGVMVFTLRKVLNNLGLPRRLIFRGGGCGKATHMQNVVVPTLERCRACRCASDQMPERMDATQTHASAWVHDEAMQTATPVFRAAFLRTIGQYDPKLSTNPGMMHKIYKRRNQYGLVALERPQPFSTSSSDVGLVTMRCNNDFKYMARGFADPEALTGSFRCEVDQLAACFPKWNEIIKQYPAVKKMAISLVALNPSASIVDYYITKYAANPMQQLQNLTTQYALGMRRLEERDERERAEQAGASGVNEPGEQQCAEKVKSNKLDEKEKRSWRVLVSLQHAANRTKMISSTECALYVRTEQQHWTSHLHTIASRPLYILSECQCRGNVSSHVPMQVSKHPYTEVLTHVWVKCAYACCLRSMLHSHASTCVRCVEEQEAITTEMCGGTKSI